MRKDSFFFLICFLFVSCTKEGGGTSNGDAATTQNVSVGSPKATETTSGSTDTGLPNEAYTFESNIEFLQTTSSQQEKFDKAVEIIKKVVATEEFRTSVLNHTYNGQKTFVDNGGYSNEQIYQKILDAVERLFPVKNNAMDMSVQLYTDNTSNVVGYTNSGSKGIFVNTKYFNTNTVKYVASNLFHEWLHKVGFTHAYSYSPSRDYSVPYAIGRIIGKLGIQFE